MGHPLVPSNTTRCHTCVSVKVHNKLQDVLLKLWFDSEENKVFFSIVQHNKAMNKY